METLVELLDKTIEFYKKKSYDKPRLEAEKIFSKALNLDRINLYINYDKKLTEVEKQKIRNLMYEKNEVIDENSLKVFLDKSVEYLKKHNVVEASLISELIFSKVINVDRMMLFLSYNKKLTDIEKDKIRKMLKAIAIDKMPYQYLVNEQNFYGRNFYVDNRVLIPRYDTEVLVEKVIENSPQKPYILDIGTGSGVIAITLGLSIPKSKVLGVDISEKAVEVSKINANLLNAKNVVIKQSDLFSNVNFNEFDIIVSNPPYISNNEIELTSPDTIHEPDIALFAKSDGLYFYYEISKHAIKFLKEGGLLAFEIGYMQKEAVIEILKKFNYVDIRAFKDLSNHDRVIIARKGKI